MNIFTERNNMLSPSLAIAADSMNMSEIFKLIVGMQKPRVDTYIKLNSAFVLYGYELIQLIKSFGLKIFLDLKFHDVPNDTMTNYIHSAASLGADVLTVHTSSGPKTLRACSKTSHKYGSHRPLILGITTLTSMSDEDLQAIGVEESREEHTRRLARLARECGLDGVVCSPAEAPEIRDICGSDFIVATPGIRLAKENKDCHVEVYTPVDALERGSNMIIMGRPICEAEFPWDVIQRVEDDILCWKGELE